jgi:hypothetical protein
MWEYGLGHIDGTMLPEVFEQTDLLFSTDQRQLVAGVANPSAPFTLAAA